MSSESSPVFPSVPAIEAQLARNATERKRLRTLLKWAQADAQAGPEHACDNTANETASTDGNGAAPQLPPT